MELLQKYFKDFLSYKFSQFISGRKNYSAWKSKNYSLRKVTLKNALLAKELEKTCSEKGGILTYSEFIEIDQFGKYGYHATHTDHGMTNVGKRWPDAIIALCKKNNISDVVELGPGTGDVAIELQKIARKQNLKIYWSGVEKNEELCDIIRKRFEKNNFTQYLKKITTDLSKISLSRKSIFLLSYILDSIPPEILVNTSSKSAFPNAMIGITVKDGVLEEHILSIDELKKKNISFHNGIIKYKGLQFDLHSWNLYPMQRAYIPLQALITFTTCIEKTTDDSLIVIIDEFRPPPNSWETNHLCLPRDLHTFTRDITNLEKAYQDAGKTLYYFPMYFDLFYKVLPSFGFRSIKYDIEQKISQELAGKSPRLLNGYYWTYAFITSQRIQQKRSTIRLEFPQVKLL